MPITNKEAWDKYVEKNSNDDYSNACIKVAEIVMRLLDEEPTPLIRSYHPTPNTARSMIVRADQEVHNGQSELSGFQAEAIVAMVQECHSRGSELANSHNILGL